MVIDRASPDARRRLRVLDGRAGPRQRVVDEHMFRFDRKASPSTTFGVEVSTAAGLLPVVVVPQLDAEGGGGLTNQAEPYVEAVWRRYLPDEPQPPIWVAHQLMTYGEAEIQKDTGLLHVGFDAVGPYTVARPPRWGPKMSTAELTKLVGGPVDLDRGAGYVPPVPRPTPTMRYVIRPLAQLPRPKLDDDPLPCMRTG